MDAAAYLLEAVNAGQLYDYLPGRYATREMDTNLNATSTNLRQCLMEDNYEACNHPPAGAGNITLSAAYSISMLHSMLCKNATDSWAAARSGKCNDPLLKWLCPSPGMLCLRAYHLITSVDPHQVGRAAVRVAGQAQQAGVLEAAERLHFPFWHGAVIEMMQPFVTKAAPNVWQAALTLCFSRAAPMPDSRLSWRGQPIIDMRNNQCAHAVGHALGFAAETGLISQWHAVHVCAQAPGHSEREEPRVGGHQYHLPNRAT